MLQIYHKWGVREQCLYVSLFSYWGYGDIFLTILFHTSSTFVFNPYYLFNCLLSYRIPQVYLTDFVQWLLLFSRFCFRGKFVFGFEAFSDVLCLVRLGCRLLIFALTFLMIMDLLLEIYFCFCFWLLLVKP